MLATKDLDPRLLEVIEKYRVLIPQRMANQNSPGLAIALVFRGNLVWAEGFGIADQATKKPATAETLFSIQSISKTFTATAVMAAVQDGLVDLDAPIVRYLPSFTVNSRFEEKPQEKITLRLLLSHRAGFTHEAPVGNNYDDCTRSFADHIRSISETWLRYPVGQRFAYSNLGIDLAGHVLEVVYNRSFAAVMDDLVFDPLGMTRSTVDHDVIEATQDCATGYVIGFNRTPRRIPIIPSGGVYSSAVEMSRFLRFHMGHGRIDGVRYLGKDVLHNMYTPSDTWEDLEDLYALGIGRRSAKRGNMKISILGHSGGGFSFLSDMSWYSILGFGLVVLTNSDDNRLLFKLRNLIVNDVFDAFLDGDSRPTHDQNSAGRVAKPIDSGRVQALTGKYCARGIQMELTPRNSSLSMKGKKHLHPLTFFNQNEGELKLGFMRHTFRVMPEGPLHPHWITCSPAGLNFDYNEGPSDPPGPNNEEWQAFLGDYDIALWGNTVECVNVHIKNGHLYFGPTKAVQELEPGLFFLCDGEALDFRGSTPTYRNIRLTPRKTTSNASPIND